MFLLFDLIFAVFFSVFSLLYVPFIIVFRKRNNQKVYFALVDATNIDAIKKKYSTLGVIKDQHFNSLFDKHILFFHKTLNKRIVELDKNFILIERPFYNNFPLVSHLRDLLFTIKMVCKEDISILRSTSLFEMGLKGWIAGKITNVPFCISIHTDLDNRERFDVHVRPKILNSRRFPCIIEHYLLKHSKNILPIRESMIRYVEKHGGKKENCHIFPHGVDFSLYEETINEDMFRKKYKLINNVKIISIVARLEKENYSEDIIKVINQTIKIREDVLFIIAGDGKEKKYFKKIQKKYDQSVKFLGLIPNEDVYTLRKISSINLCLMAGFTLIEAAYSGNPCISYNVEWHYEIIVNNETGYLVEEHNVPEVVGKIMTLLDNDEERTRIGNNAKRVVKKHYCIEKSNQIKREIFLKVMDLKYA